MREIIGIPVRNIYDLEGSIFEGLIYLTQEELLDKVDDLSGEIKKMWLFYNESGYRSGTNEERIHPDPSYLYGAALEEMAVTCSVLRFKQVNEARKIHQALSPDETQMLQTQLLSMIKSSPKMTYIDLLKAFPDQEIEIIIEDLIESKQLKRVNMSIKNKEKWKI